MTINALPNDFDIKGMDEPNKVPTHVIPTALCEINDEAIKKIVRSPDRSKILKSRSKSTHMSASQVVDLAKTG